MCSVGIQPSKYAAKALVKRQVQLFSLWLLLSWSYECRFANFCQRLSPWQNKFRKRAVTNAEFGFRMVEYGARVQLVGRVTPCAPLSIRNPSAGNGVPALPSVIYVGDEVTRLISRPACPPVPLPFARDPVLCSAWLCPIQRTQG